MDETGVFLSVLNRPEVLVGKNQLRNYRGVRAKPTPITVMEYFSAGGWYFHAVCNHLDSSSNSRRHFVHPKSDTQIGRLACIRCNMSLAHEPKH